MKSPFFVTGLARSGTTLVRRLVSMHPLLEHELVHENIRPLLRARRREDAVRALTYPATQAGEQTGAMMSLRSGLKQPYLKFREGRRYVRKFVKLFPRGSVIHVVRNPFSVVSSQVRTFSMPARRAIRRYFRSVPRMRALVQTLDRHLEIRYADLMARPEESVASLYEWMGEEASSEHVTRVVTTRDPWEYRGRIMPGLRYFDTILDRPIQLEPLQQGHIERIAALCRRHNLFVATAEEVDRCHDEAEIRG